MNIKALQLESRFSLPPNSLGYCGQDTAGEKFKQCIINNKCEGVEEEVTKFIVLHPYLKTISQITSLPKFSHEVIESYWIGNDLLKQFKPEHYDLLLDNFLEQGVPDFFVKELRNKKPKSFIPSHLFQVLHIGVGKASGAVPFNLDSINNCMIRWGKIDIIKKNNAAISLNSLKQNSRHAEFISASHTRTKKLKNNGILKQVQDDDKKEEYELINTHQTIPFNPDIVQNLKAGDTVAVHWNQVIKVLTPEEEKKLLFWTKKAVEINNGC